jgi:hypothetical protein
MRHILLATVENPHDPKSWSGTPYNILKALESKFDKVTVLSSPVPKKNWFDSLLRIVLGRNKYPLWMTKDALKWAASTYIVAAIASVATLLYYLQIYMGRRD